MARDRTLTRIHRRLAVSLPAAPGLRASLHRRLTYSRVLTLKLRKIYPGTVTRSFASARASSDRATLRLWQVRSAAAALAVAAHAQPRPDAGLPGWLRQAFLCIHSYEGAWTSNTGNGYYGGLQMDWGFMRSYGPEFVRRGARPTTGPSGAARGGGAGARVGTRIHSVAEHRARLRPALASRRGATPLSGGDESSADPQDCGSSASQGRPTASR